MLNSVFMNLLGRESLIAADNTWGLLGVMCLAVAFSIFLEQKYKWASKISGAIIALIIAMILANIPGITLPFDYSVFLGPVVLVWYIVTELGSIVENAGALGAPIPAFLQAAIKSLNDAVDGSEK